MEYFAVVCLVAIIVTIANLLTWMWRNIDIDDNGGFIVLSVAATVVGIVFISICVNYIILWGQPIIK